MTGRLAGLAWLLFVWLVLLGEVTAGTVLVGAALGAALLSFFRPMRGAAGPFAFRPVKMAAFLGYFHGRFLEANVQVALAVIQPRRIRRRGIVAVPIAAPTDLTTMILANAVSLTPGTFILELRRDPAIMYVHVLQLGSVREARLSILELERRIVAALGPAGSVARVEALMAAVEAEDRTGEHAASWPPD